MTLTLKCGKIEFRKDVLPLMENYQRLYASLFNRITDLISELEQNEFTQESVIASLQQIQLDAEEDFITEHEHHEPTLEECMLKDNLILNNGLMSILIDSPQYANDPGCARLLSELNELMTEAGKNTIQYIQEHPEGILRWD